MAWTIFGFGEDIDAAGATVNLAGLLDNHVSVSGDNITVPELNQLVWACAGVSSGGTGVATLSTPTLQVLSDLVLYPTNGGADGDNEPNSPPVIFGKAGVSRQLTTNEFMTASIHSNTSAAAFQWVIVAVADAPIVPITPTNMFTVRATGTTTQVARQWSAVSYTLTESLQVGVYQIVGIVSTGASQIACRVVSRTSPWRPGVICGDTDTSELDAGRYGNYGVFTTFSSTNFPTFEVLSDLADTAQDLILDLVKVS